jgi:hypothetical protein
LHPGLTLYEARFLSHFARNLLTIENSLEGFLMRTSFASKFASMGIAAAVIAGLSLNLPAFAQQGSPGGDQFSSAGDSGMFSSTQGGSAQSNTGSQTQQEADSQAPTLQGATNGTIGPQGADATYITGVNTAGTVRVNNLANLEALLNIIANGMEILGIAWGGPTMIMGFMHMAAGTQDAMKKVLFGAAGVTGGLATPGCINWLVASARDANLFS